MSTFEHLLSTKAKHVTSPRMAGVNYDLTFSYGYPAPENLPAARLVASAQAALSADAEGPLQYSGASGSPKFVDVLLAKLARDQKIMAGRENVLVTAGSMQVIGLLNELLLDAGDTVIVEGPTFLGAVRVFQNAGAKLETIGLDQDGIRIDHLTNKLAELKARGVTPKFLYVIPNFQNPAGVNLSLERRAQLIKLAKDHRTLILEDDAYFDIRFAGEPLPTMYEMAGRKGVVYAGTFSKTLSPGMRIGWAVGEPELITRMTTLKVDGTGAFSTAIAAAFCADHGLESNIAKLRKDYGNRAQVMLDSLDEYMPKGVTFSRPDGGFFVWVTLPESVDSMKLVEYTRKHGVDFLPGVRCFADGQGRNNMRLAFSYVPIARIPEGIKIMADGVREQMTASL